jgi:hypothetical protein
MNDICIERASDLKDQTEVEAASDIAAFCAAMPDIELPMGSTRRTGYAYTRDELLAIIAAIPIPKNRDDPKLPIFPPNSPRYPATPSRRLERNKYILIIKYESYNSTGSHKDRWAWEKLLSYRKSIQNEIDNLPKSGGSVEIRPFSMISAGSAAFALQSLFRLYDLPPLRVVMDAERTDAAVRAKLESVGAKIFLTDLDERELSEADILSITDNKFGKDITTRDANTPENEMFYDWLVCEILTQKPTYIFVPFGTGDLFVNIITFIEAEARKKQRSKRLVDAAEDIRGIHVLGATAKERTTLMDKLYAKHRPPEEAIHAKVRALVASEVLGAKSGVFPITDKVADQGLRFAQANGLNTELSGIAGLGLLFEQERQLGLKPEDRVVVVNTGWLHTHD